MDRLDAWLQAMPVDDIRARISELERELARLRLLLADAPKAASKSATVTAPVARPKAARGRKRARRLSPERQAILAIVREHPNGVAPADVARRLGKHGGTTQAAMWRMATQSTPAQLVNVGGVYQLPPTTATDDAVPSNGNATMPLDQSSGSEVEAMNP